jgi:hypothetical protein
LGDRASAVDGVVQHYLAAQMRGSAVLAAAALGGVAGDPADVVCQACNKRSGAATTLLCDRCDWEPHSLPGAGAAWCA